MNRIKLFLFSGIALILGGSVVKAQTKSERQKIVSSYDAKKLTNLESELRLRMEQKKEEALIYAQKHNLKVRDTIAGGGLRELQYIENGKPIYYKTDNINAAKLTRANFLQIGGSLNLNLTGKGMRVHVWDGGVAWANHREFDGPGGTDRYTVGDRSYGAYGHPTHVAGIIMAAGIDPGAKGMAAYCQVTGYDWNNDVAEATQAAASGMLVSNHSYSLNAPEGVPNDLYYGGYTAASRDWDNLMFATPYYLMVKSAGNDGNKAVNPSPLNPALSEYDKLIGAATSKNNIVVTAVDQINTDNNGVLLGASPAWYGSRGPTDDLRVKPDIAGIGDFVYSSYYNGTDVDNYERIQGTSQATPNVSGSLILLQEYYSKLSNGSFMRAATLKGLALHTADDIEAAGPDARTGWGVLNVKKAAETMKASFQGTATVKELTLTQGQIVTYKVSCANSSQLKASISWTDPAGALSAVANSNNAVLVNDLDIRITKDGVTYFPWRLTGVNTNGKGDNIKDPFERIDIDNAAGIYTITISHKGVLRGGSQDFSLIVTGGVTSKSYCSTNIQDINIFQIRNVSFNTINNSSTISSTGYSDFGTLLTTIEKGRAYTLSVTAFQSTSSPAVGYAAWIDFNQNGEFENSELVGSATNASTLFECRVNIPATALGGLTRMRVAINYFNPAAACGSRVYGETEDYSVNIVLPDTTSPSAPQDLTAKTTIPNSIILNWTAASDYEGVVAYEVYKNGALYKTVTTNTATITGISTGNSYQFYVKAKDAAGNLSAGSNTATVPLFYCTNYNMLTNFGYISYIIFNTIQNSSTNNPVGYSDYTDINTVVKQGQTYSFILYPSSLLQNGMGVPTNYYVWIDYNQNGSFEGSELAATALNILSEQSRNITIPSSALSGKTRMRVIMNSLGMPYATCGIDVAGEIEDYSITISNIPPAAPVNLKAKNNMDFLTLSWDPSTDNTGVAGYEVYQDGVLVQTVSTNSADIAGLTAGNSYQFYVKAKDLAGNISTRSNILEYIKYCNSYFTYGAVAQHISNVQFGTINNSSGGVAGGYSDFTNISTNVFKGNVYQLSLTQGNPEPNPYNQVYSIWIDYNRNGIFESDERVAQFRDQQWQRSIPVTIPTTASTGPTRMRIIMYNTYGDITPCDIVTTTLGEVEDYTVNIVNPLTVTASGITQNSISLSWASFPNAVRYEIYRDNVLIDTTTGTSYTTTGLSPGTACQFYVKAKNAAAEVLTTSNTLSVSTYCNAIGKTPGGIQLVEISNIRFNTINNTSPALLGGYSDFSSVSTTVAKGQSYALTISNTLAIGLPHYYVAWIDYNQNGVFEDTERAAYGVAPTTNSPVTYTIAIPNAANTGNTRMRVAVRWGSDPLSCGSFEYGDVEDYTINITSSAASRLSPESTSAMESPVETVPIIKIYPNPVSDLLYLSDIQFVSEIEIYRLSGELVMRLLANKSVDVSALNKGVYIMKIHMSDGMQQSVKFIKK